MNKNDVKLKKMTTSVRNSPNNTGMSISSLSKLKQKSQTLRKNIKEKKRMSV